MMTDRQVADGLESRPPMRHRFHIPKAGMRINGSVGLIPAVIIALIACTATGARADQIDTIQRDLHRVRIIGFQAGALQYRSAEVGDGACPVAEIRRLLVQDRHELKDLNEAEEYLSRDRPEDALIRYERALRLADDYWPDVIRCRLLMALARTDHLERTVKLAIDLMSTASVGPSVVLDLLPSKLTAADAESRERALRYLASFESQTHDEEASALFTLLRYRILVGRALADRSSVAQEVSSLSAPRTFSAMAVYRTKLDAAKDLLASHETGVVLRSIDEDIEYCPMELLPEFIFVKGDAIMAGADDRAMLLLAAGSFMRLPIHFPEHPLTPSALRRAAAIHERIGRPDHALTLLRECKNLPTLSADVRQAVEADIRKLESRS